MGTPKLIGALTDAYSLPLVVGGSAVEPARVVYLASGVIAHARGNAAATARGIAGVTLGSAAAGARALVQRTGPVRIAADSSCSPSMFGKAYLSNEAGGKVASIIDGTFYPLLLGYFTESAVAADGTVEVALQLDEHRDDSGEWILSTWSGGADASDIDFPVNVALFRDLRISGSACTGNAYQFRVDGAVPVVFWYGISYSGPGGGSNELTCGAGAEMDVRVIPTASIIMAEATYNDGSNSGKYVLSRFSYPATSIGVRAINAVGAPTNGFVSGTSIVQLLGRVRA